MATAAFTVLHYQGYAIYRQAMLVMGRGGIESALLQSRDILERSLKTRPWRDAQLLSSIDGQLIAKVHRER